MRDFLLLSAIAALLTIALRRPFVGLIVWAWFTIMTPHQLAYGVYGVPLNLVIAGVTLIAYITSGEIRRFTLTPITVSIIALAGWISLSQLFSVNPEHSAPYTDRFLKTLLFVLMCAQMATTKLRLHALIWVLVAGIGFFAAKGGLFTLMTLGEFRVQGLPLTVLEDNNHFGIATAATLPMMLYLYSQAQGKWLRRALLMLFVFSVIGIFGTHSRGGFITLAAFGGLMWWRSRRKVSIALATIAVCAPLVAFMPAKWTERMGTITTASQDNSFMGRVDAWIINYKLANAHPITGAGLRTAYLDEVAVTVDTIRGINTRAAHSIYFEMLGGTGYVGFALYMTLLALGLLTVWRVYGRRKEPAMEPWKPELAQAIQSALILFAIGGASVSMEMWDGYLLLIACAGALAKLTPIAARPPRYANGNTVLKAPKINPASLTGIVRNDNQPPSFSGA